MTLTNSSGGTGFEKTASAPDSNALILVSREENPDCYESCSVRQVFPGKKQQIKAIRAWIFKTYYNRIKNGSLNFLQSLCTVFGCDNLEASFLKN